VDKKMLSVEDIEAQVALELPERETLQTVVVSCLAVCIGQIRFRDVNVAVANNICLQVGAIATALNQVLTVAGLFGTGDQGVVLGCDIKGGNQGGGGGGGGNG